MAADTAIMIGLGIITAGLLSISYKLNESNQAIFNYIGILFLSLAIGTLQVIGAVVVQIATDAGYAAITSQIVEPVLWIVGLGMFAFWIGLAAKALWHMIIFMYTAVSTRYGGQVREGDQGL